MRSEERDGRVPGTPVADSSIPGCADSQYEFDLTARVPQGAYDGADLADANADDWWRSAAWRGIEQLAATPIEWTADELRALGVPDPDHPNRWGGVFLAAKRAGLIELVAVRPSTTPSRHGGLVRIWRGVRR